MKRMSLAILGASLMFFACESNKGSEEKQSLTTDSLAVEKVDTPVDIKTERTVSFLENAPVIDGVAEEAWESLEWFPINNNWLGKEITAKDFNGKFKLAWNESKLFLLVEVEDDSLIDQYAAWDSLWWNDDCVEIFIDEDYSKGNHQFNHNAFAYHVGLNYDVVDLGPDSLPHLYNEHIEAKHVRKGKISTWEFAISIYNDTYVDGKTDNVIEVLKDGKELGFMLAYCDNDTSATRENFVGSEFVKGEEKDRDRGWIDAGEFGKLTLKK